jgi:general stress protein 26
MASRDSITRTDDAARKKVLDLLKDVKIAMMATRGEDGRMHSRPMATNTVEFDGHLWFFTEAGSPKLSDLARDAEVLLTYADDHKQNYVSVTGHGEIVRDTAKQKELWNEALRVWFPKGAEDPDIALIKVTVDGAEYWDAPSSTMIHAYGYLKAVTTGERPHPGENATVRF